MYLRARAMHSDDRREILLTQPEGRSTGCGRFAPQFRRLLADDHSQCSSPLFAAMEVTLLHLWLRPLLERPGLRDSSLEPLSRYEFMSFPVGARHERSPWSAFPSPPSIYVLRSPPIYVLRPPPMGLIALAELPPGPASIPAIVNTGTRTGARRHPLGSFES
jgi:hypothetical protein